MSGTFFRKNFTRSLLNNFVRSSRLPRMGRTKHGHSVTPFRLLTLPPHSLDSSSPDKKRRDPQNDTRLVFLCYPERREGSGLCVGDMLRDFHSLLSPAPFGFFSCQSRSDAFGKAAVGSSTRTRTTIQWALENASTLSALLFPLPCSGRIVAAS